MLFFEHDIYSQTQTRTQPQVRAQIQPRPQTVRLTSAEIIKNEENMQYARELQEIVDYIDAVYTRAYENLKNGGKLVIFIHPAHGRMPCGEWHGGWSTGRASATGLPEEHFSIAFSRKLFDLLNANPHIQIKTTEDFWDVLHRRTDEYRRVDFATATRLAKEKNAFIMLSQHLNNVSMDRKAGGIANIAGIHILRDSRGNYSLGRIPSVSSGFLTLYNRFDA